MKTVILTMTSGEGHNSIAKVLSAQFAKMDIQSEIVDIFRNDGWEYQFNKLGYLWACRFFPKTYDYFWKALKFRNSNKRYSGIAQKEVEKIADDVFERVRLMNFDFLVAVHPYCAILCDLWKRQGKIADKKAFALLTDILPHPLWESAICCDYVLTPTTHAFLQLADKGFTPQQMIACGFPVAEKFLQRPEKSQVREQLGLKDKFTVLVASGGFGIGQNSKVVKRLSDSDVQILCVNGKNKREFIKTQKMQKKYRKTDIANYGFVDNMDQLMSCADVIVSRAGAATLFEAMSKQLPIIIREKTIINERENAEILQSENAVIKLEKLSDVKNAVDKLQQPDVARQMQRACLKVTQGLCAKDVCDKIVSLL